MNRKAVVVLIFGLFISSVILYSSCDVELVGEFCSIRNLSIVLNDGSKFDLKPSFPGSGLLYFASDLLYNWFRSQEVTVQVERLISGGGSQLGSGSFYLDISSLGSVGRIEVYDSSSNALLATISSPSVSVVKQDFNNICGGDVYQYSSGSITRTSSGLLLYEDFNDVSDWTMDSSNNGGTFTAVNGYGKLEDTSSSTIVEVRRPLSRSISSGIVYVKFKFMTGFYADDYQILELEDANNVRAGYAGHDYWKPNLFTRYYDFALWNGSWQYLEYQTNSYTDWVTWTLIANVTSQKFELVEVDVGGTIYSLNNIGFENQLSSIDYVSLTFANPSATATAPDEAYYDDLIVCTDTKLTFNGLNEGMIVELWDGINLVSRKLALSSSLFFNIESDGINIPFNGSVKIFETVKISVSNVQGNVYFKVYGFSGNLLWTTSSITVYDGDVISIKTGFTGSQSVNISEGWESGSLNGWSLHDTYFSSFASGTITAGASTYTANTGGYSAEIYGDLTFTADYHKAYSYFSIPINENVSEVSVSYYMYTKEYASGSADSTSTYVEGKLYIKIYNYTSGSTQTLWGPYERDSPSWSSYSKQWVFSDIVKLIEVGFRAYFYGGNIGSGSAYLDGWVYIDDVNINYKKVAPVSTFQVSCDYSISGKYIKASENAPYDSANYTLTVYHNYMSNSSWVYAYQTPVYNATLPFSSSWISGWITMLTPSEEESRFYPYYIKVELNVEAIDLSGQVISSSAYAVLTLDLYWKVFAFNGPPALRLVEVYGLTPRITVSSEGLTASIMTLILTFVAAYLVWKREELD